jgi:hypothetical protein
MTEGNNIGRAQRINPRWVLQTAHIPVYFRAFFIDQIDV